MKATWTLGLSLALLALPAAAFASAQDEAAAEQLFQKGKELMQEGNLSEACAKLAESQRLDPAVGTLLYLGECYERAGKLASAWATFQAAAAAGRKANQQERIQIAIERAEALIERLPLVAVHVASEANVAGLQVRRDGTLLGDASFGVATPVDPGEHHILATAPGRKEWATTIQAIAGTAPQTVEIPVLELLPPSPEPAPPVAASPPLPPALRTSPAPAPFDSTQSTSHQRIYAYASAGIGIIGIATGTVFGLRAKNKEEDSREYCLPEDRTACSSEGVELLDQGRKAALISNIGFAVGAAGVLGGVILYLTEPNENVGASAPTLVPVVERRSLGMLWTQGF